MNKCDIGFCGSYSNGVCLLNKNNNEVNNCLHMFKVKKLSHLLLEIYKRDNKLNSKLPFNIMDSILGIIGKGNEKHEMHKS